MINNISLGDKKEYFKLQDIYIYYIFIYLYFIYIFHFIYLYIYISHFYFPQNFPLDDHRRRCKRNYETINLFLRLRFFDLFSRRAGKGKNPKKFDRNETNGPPPRSHNPPQTRHN